MTRIYTKTGDDGTTGLIGGKRVSKDALRIEAYGAIDELNAVLGVASAHPVPERVHGILRRIQDDLFSVGANLALPAGMEHGSFNVPPIVEDQITAPAIHSARRECSRCTSAPCPDCGAARGAALRLPGAY